VRLNPRQFRGVGGREERAKQAPESVTLGVTEQELGRGLSNCNSLKAPGKAGREPDMGSGLHGGKGSIRVRDRSKQLRSELSESHSISPHPT